MVDISVRHAEPNDAEAIHRILSGPRATSGTLQLPLQSVEVVRRRFLEIPEGLYHLVACAEGEVVGHLCLETLPNRPRRRHVGSLGMAVREDLQGRGVGTALMEAALDLADNWLGLTRVELFVYVDNTAGVTLYKKVGFEVEGTHRHYAFRDGQYAHAYSMARIK
jgi:putative acetyltransferase